MSAPNTTTFVPPAAPRLHGPRAQKSAPAFHIPVTAATQIRFVPRTGARRHADTIFDSDELFLPTAAYTPYIPVDVTSFTPSRTTSTNWSGPETVTAPVPQAQEINSTMTSIDTTNLPVIEPGEGSDDEVHSGGQTSITYNPLPRLSEYAFGGDEYVPGMGYGTARSHGSRVMKYKTVFQEEEEVIGGAATIGSFFKKMWRKMRGVE